MSPPSPPPPQHTLQPPCRLTPAVPPQPDQDLPDIPPLTAQFFYASPIPIDDPLAAATLIGADTTVKLPLRPFAAGDNAALERTWLALASDRDRRNHALALRRTPSPAVLGKEAAERLAAIVNTLALRHRERHDREGVVAVGVGVGVPERRAVTTACCAELRDDVEGELRTEFCAVTRRRFKVLDLERVLESVMAQLARLRMEAETGKGGPDAGLLGTSPAVHIVGSAGSRSSAASADGVVLSSSLPVGGLMTARPPMLDDGISGKPFVRVEPTSRSNRSSGVATPDERALKTLIRGRARADSRTSARAPPAAEQLEDTAEIPVGISRLHMVSLPELQMKPIYWSPVNDIATVLRATWFYRWAHISSCP